MVHMVIKKDGKCQFLYHTSVETPMTQVYEEVTTIQNNRTKIMNICYEIEELAKHGPIFPVNMQGLAPGQAEELGLVDEWADKCVPSDGYTMNPDPLQRRNGRQPSEKMKDVLLRAVEEAKKSVSEAQIGEEVYTTMATVSQALHTLRGAVQIVYPMGLPPFDMATVTLKECEEPAKCNTDHRDFLDITTSVIWFCGRVLLREGKLGTALKTTNDKTKVRVVLSRPEDGAPAREPVISEDERAKLLAYAKRKEEELKVTS